MNHDMIVLEQLTEESNNIKPSMCVEHALANIKDTFARIKNGEVFVTNMYIAKYDEGNRFNHEERRSRKLLLLQL